MATITNDFTATGVGGSILVKPGDSFSYEVSGTFDGTVVLEKTNNGGATYTVVDTLTAPQASMTIVSEDPAKQSLAFRFRCEVYTSGTITATLIELAAVIGEFKDLSGNTVLQITEDGLPSVPVDNLSVQQVNHVYIDPTYGDADAGNGSLALPYASIVTAMDNYTPSPGTLVKFTYLTGGETNLPSDFVIKEWSSIGSVGLGPLLGRADGKEIQTSGDGFFFMNGPAFVTGLKFNATFFSIISLSNVNVSSQSYVFTTTCVDDVSQSLAGTSLLLPSPLFSYRIWLRVSGAGADPTQPGEKSLVVDINTDDVAADIATAIVTQLGGTVQLQKHNNDFSVDAGDPGQFIITMVCPVDVGEMVDADTGFTVDITTQGYGLQIVGDNPFTFISAGLEGVECSGLNMKFANSRIRNSRFPNIRISADTDYTSLNFHELDDVQFATMGLGGFLIVNRNGNSTQGALGVAVRLVNGLAPFPIFSGDGVGEYQKRTATTTSGSDIISASVFGGLAEGIPISGPGLPLGTYIGRSIDLTDQFRLVDNTDTPVLSTQTQTDVFFDTRNVCFQDGNSINQFTTIPDAFGVRFNPEFFDEWPNSNGPRFVGQALDGLSTRNLVKENLTLGAGEIASQYVQLGYAYRPGSIRADIRPLATPTVFNPGFEGTGYEYTLEDYVDANGVTKTLLVFDTNWATAGAKEVLAGDVLHVQGLIQRDNF